MASATQWTWVWVNSGRQWRTGQPGVLQAMGSKILGHDRVTKQHHTISYELHSPREIFMTSWRSSFQSTSFWQRPMSPCLSDSTSVSTSLCQFHFCGFSKNASLNGGLLKLIEPIPHRMETSSEPRTPQVVLTCVFSDLKALSVLGRRSWGLECLLQPVCRTRLKRVLATAWCYVLDLATSSLLETKRPDQGMHIK